VTPQFTVSAVADAVAAAISDRQLVTQVVDAIPTVTSSTAQSGWRLISISARWDATLNDRHLGDTSSARISSAHTPTTEMSS